MCATAKDRRYDVTALLKVIRGAVRVRVSSAERAREQAANGESGLLQALASQGPLMVFAMLQALLGPSPKARVQKVTCLLGCLAAFPGQPPQSACHWLHAALLALPPGEHFFSFMPYWKQQLCLCCEEHSARDMILMPEVLCISSPGMSLMPSSDVCCINLSSIALCKVKWKGKGDQGGECWCFLGPKPGRFGVCRDAAAW